MYFILIPTLRCDISCDYCQVSRANINSTDHDWTQATTQHTKNLLLEHSSKKIKIEFQGGEPTLRIDIIEDIIAFCDQCAIEAEFIICTNLHTINTRLLKMIERDDCFLSTSIDGDHAVHTHNRTKSYQLTNDVINNYKYIKRKFGNNKINALPTMVNFDVDAIKNLIDFYIDLGQTSIFLRPVNYQGFARKKYPNLKHNISTWTENYLQAIDYIFDYNHRNDAMISEFNLEVVIRRIFTPSFNSHTDFRTPSPTTIDSLVIDYNGKLYPSDEARMLSRINHVDLSLGDIFDGINKKTVSDINWQQMNEIHPDCIHCAFKPFCGIDIVDDISRYNRIDLTKERTNFCFHHKKIFEYIFSKLLENNPFALVNIFANVTGRSTLMPVMTEWKYE
ncbi:MAG: His-Xaa-Ser system radical SAM maturase HxsB [Gammaproteobacteria bacterium]|nr:His-Xaa-Ser system radical SAM maturase HxsB [Gammaproteobacteria bacterium]MDH5731139.1 His-Xaa-Ser system radical SAM maturase HxsB [Gammaproteobacteria bacterium]